MFRFNLKSVVCSFALVSAVLVLPGCSSETNTPTSVHPSSGTSESTKTTVPPEQDNPDYQFWANFCGNIRILMSSGGVEWHINLLPGEKIGLSSPNIDDLIATKRPYFEKLLAQGVFSADTPRDFRVAIKERCTRLG